MAALGAGLLAGGGTALGVALATQVHAPQPTAAQRGTIAAPPRPVRADAPAARVIAAVLERLRGEMTPHALTASLPVWLSIPAIGVNGPLGEVGRNPNGTIQVPPLYARPSEAAWYRLSPTPGALGPAVIVGHVDDYLGPAVFFHLGALRPGEQVDVRRADGTVAVFRVDGVRRYAKTAFPTAAVYGTTRAAALRLVTCGGAFDAATRHYLDSIVVYASLAGVRHVLPTSPAA